MLRDTRQASRNEKMPNIMMISEGDLDEIKNLILDLQDAVEGVAGSDEVFTTEEAAQFLKVSTKTLQKYRDSKKVSFSQHGREIWYLKSDLLEFLKKHRIQGR